MVNLENADFAGVETGRILYYYNTKAFRTAGDVRFRIRGMIMKRSNIEWKLMWNVW